MNTTRRDFLKKSGLIISAVPLMGLINLLPAPEAIGLPVDETDIVKLFNAELLMYPKGSVAESIYKVKSVEVDDFSSKLMLLDEGIKATRLAGLSISLDRKKIRYWHFLVNENKFMSDLVFRRDVMDGMIETMRINWKRTVKKPWGIAMRN